MPNFLKLGGEKNSEHFRATNDFCRSTKRQLLERYLSLYLGRTGRPAAGRVETLSEPAK